MNFYMFKHLTESYILYIHNLYFHKPHMFAYFKNYIHLHEYTLICPSEIS